MTEKSCFHLEESKPNNVIHNDRTISPSYLLKEKSLGVEVKRNAEEAQKLYEAFYDETNMQKIIINS